MEITISPLQQVKLIYEQAETGQIQMIKTDEVKLKRILTNLINNALKFTRTGTINFGYQLLADDYVGFHVKDTGKGISQEDQEIIFERYRQPDEAHHYINSGIGLGLSICKYYSTLLGGNICVESKPGLGSTFHFNIKNQLDKNSPES